MSIRQSALAAAVAGPSIGPTTILILGESVPLMAVLLSLAGLVLARAVAPIPKVPVSRVRTVALTLLLCIIDFAAVLHMQPGAGMAVALGVGLGFSGMLAVQFFGDRVKAVLVATFGIKDT